MVDLVGHDRIPLVVWMRCDEVADPGSRCAQFAGRALFDKIEVGPQVALGVHVDVERVEVRVDDA